MTVAVQGRARKERRDREPRPGLIARLRRSYDQHWYAWVMCAPVVLVLAALVGYPLVQGVLLTFTNANSLNVGRTIGVNHIPDTYSWVGFKNYVDLITGPDNQLVPHFVWTIVWTAVCVVLTVGTGLGLAVLLNRRIRGRAVYRMLLVLPWAVPTFVTVFSWRLLLSDGGAVDGLLGLLHLPQPSWLSDPLAMKVAAILVNTWVGFPFMMLSFLGGLQSIPNELYEAAEMDGATPWQRFTQVTLPGLRPVSSTVMLLGIIWTFNQFNVIYLLFGSGGDDSVQILVTYAYQLFFGQMPQDYAGSAAVGVICLSILVVFTGFYRRWVARNGAAA
ncbi:carbohydrate ABC transporter permease [Streptacidiphilus carbonis]|uniref:carbohydrate ABC transporter permease n=1 Tax=Streptacidiphilus carbonis TaxID=105422 RepID=UPI0005A77677|nr:sugar ABC transporter permease [Streptacidiphilus carbonis]